jgi:1-acyl-sn-glycerol-3-phosphate acyltransferase
MRLIGRSRTAAVEESLPALGPSAPWRRYGWLQSVGRFVLRRKGWRTEGELPDCPKLVAALAPHSSNWDFIIGASVVLALGLRVAFIGKHTLFQWPLGAFMRWLGGIPVNRARPDGFADAMIAEFGAREQLWLGVAPEGTRTDGAQFKSGFYRIARAAGVPILPVYFNYRRKVMGFLPLVHPDRDVDGGVAAVRDLLEHHGARKAR